MNRRFIPAIAFAITVISLALVSQGMAVSIISQDFESLTLYGTNTPSRWSFVVVDNTPNTGYLTTNGMSGAGLGGQIRGKSSISSGMPGAYLVVNGVAGGAPFDLNQTITGSFDFNIQGDGSTGYKSGIFCFGDIETGISKTNPGEYAAIRLMQNSFANRGGFFNGVGAQLYHLNDGTSLSADTWYSSSFSWTPTNGLTGDFSFTANGWTRAISNFTFSSKAAFFGFGAGGYASNEHWPIFDNIVISGQPINPAGTFITLK